MLWLRVGPISLIEDQQTKGQRKGQQHPCKVGITVGGGSEIGSSLLAGTCNAPWFGGAACWGIGPWGVWWKDVVPQSGGTHQYPQGQHGGHQGLGRRGRGKQQRHEGKQTSRDAHQFAINCEFRVDLYRTQSIYISIVYKVWLRSKVALIRHILWTYGPTWYIHRLMWVAMLLQSNRIYMWPFWGALWSAPQNNVETVLYCFSWQFAIYGWQLIQLHNDLRSLNVWLLSYGAICRSKSPHHGELRFSVRMLRFSVRINFLCLSDAIDHSLWQIGQSV